MVKNSMRGDLQSCSMFIVTSYWPFLFGILRCSFNLVYFLLSFVVSYTIFSKILSSVLSYILLVLKLDIEAAYFKSAYFKIGIF